MWKTKSTMIHVVKVVMGAKKNDVPKANIVVKATIITKVVLEIAAHAARVVAFVQVELERRKIANAQLGLFESSYKLL
jgi:hypothetical protein